MEDERFFSHAYDVNNDFEISLPLVDFVEKVAVLVLHNNILKLSLEVLGLVC